MRYFIALSILIISIQAKARTDIWGSIPFLRGQDLCAYREAYGKKRMEFMKEMTDLASQLMDYGAAGPEALEMLKEFDTMYDRHKRLAVQGKLLDVTLESTLKTALSNEFRRHLPSEEKVSFRHLQSLESIIRDLKRNQRPGHFEESMMEELDYIAYGTYHFSPNCRGNILVTLHLIGRDGVPTSYEGQGRVEKVMRQIAKQLFDDFQKTSFPTSVRLGKKTLRLLSPVGRTTGLSNDPRLAAEACELVDARLPNRRELELLSMLGDYNGGISIGNDVWVMPNGKIYHPRLMNPTPVRSTWEINEKEFRFYCVQ